LRMAKSLIGALIQTLITWLSSPFLTSFWHAPFLLMTSAAHYLPRGLKVQQAQFLFLNGGVSFSLEA